MENRRNYFYECSVACYSCFVACERCAAECLKERDVNMLANCIKLDLVCAAICKTTGEALSLGSEFSHKLCQLCADICVACAEECEQHDAMTHCKECAEECRKCSEACLDMVEQMPQGTSH